MLKKNKPINQGSEIPVNSPVFWVGVVGVGYPGWVPGALKISMEPKKPPILKGKSSSIFDPSTIFGFQHVNLFTTRISMERFFCWGILTTQLYMGMIYDYFINIS